MTKILPIGIENFRDMILKNCYYVDKTAFIKPLMTSGSKVQLITRPRRFGKTIFIDMLKCFLQSDLKNPGVTDAVASLFAGLAISKDEDFCRQFMGRRPVISLSLKGVEGGDFSKAYRQFADKLEAAVAPYDFLLESPRLNARDKTILRNYLTEGYLKDERHLDDSKNFLKNFAGWLAKHYETQVVLLVDEYDVPLAKAAQFGYYDEMLELVRSFLGQILKEDPRPENDASAFLMKAILTGCLRVSKESIFTDVNNPSVNTVCSEDLTLSEVIGFNTDETAAMLTYYGLSSRFDDVRHWYDGYRFYRSEIYCPWDVINFSDLAVKSGDAEHYEPQNYWDKTSDNAAVKEFLDFLTEEDADRMQTLVDGGTVEVTINEKLTYRDFAAHQSADFWTLLLFTGYLTVECRVKGTVDTYRVRIPNAEVRDCFVKNVKVRFSAKNQSFVRSGQAFAQAALSGDAARMEETLAELLRSYVSVRDAATKAPAENYYHGFLTALLASAGKFAEKVQSNPEAGDGYADIAFASGTRADRTGVVIEVKYCRKSEDLYDGADAGLHQIKEKRYTAILDKWRCTKKCVYGIAFCRKDCAVSGGEFG